MIFTLAGSNSTESINQLVAEELASQLCCFYYDSRRIDIPVYNRDLRIVSEIQNLYNLICEYEYIVFAIPEYNGNFPSFFKNIVDELSVYDRMFLKDKKVFIIAVTTGSLGGVGVREIASNTFTHFGAHVVNTYGIPNYESVDKQKSEISYIAQDIKSYLV